MDGFVEVCASLESNGGLERQVLAQILLVSSTASSNQDYSNTGQSLDLIFSQDGEECVNISVAADQVLEGNEIFTVVLLTDDPDVNVTLRAATVSVIDSESK